MKTDDRPMINYVVRTARGLLRTVRAANPYEAWQTAARKHKLEVLFTLAGEAYVEFSLNGVMRARDIDVEPIWAESFYCDAIMAEIPVAAEEMVAFTNGKPFDAPALRRMLAERGLLTLDGEDCAITDLGRAFVRRAQAAQ